MELLPLVCLCLLSCSGETSAAGDGVKVVMKEDSDAVLPCLISTKEDITGEVFFWKKDFQKEVFMYDSGIHYNNGFTGQDQQFKGRVSHFQDQLKNGNASIKIQNTKMADSGNYSCIFPRLQPRQTFIIELVVERLLKDRSGEIPGASKPVITSLYVTKDLSLLLQCEVQGAFPKPKVEWQDSTGNILPAEEPQVSERGGRYYVTLKTTVTKTGHYRCVATQEDISHQIHAETYEKLNDLSIEVYLWRLAAIVLGVGLLLVAAVMGRRCYGLCKKPPDDDDVKKPRKSPLSNVDSLQRRRRRDDSENDSSGYHLVQMPPRDDTDSDSSAFWLEQFLDFSSGDCGGGGGDGGCDGDDGCDE
ncbi:butyrophilin-like protein 8 [Pagrus major]|uniref:butyrophilin-like protein 8 n=1 Tax=Pagrus major TaxID=143350 RepID=UPI003CC84D6F